MENEIKKLLNNRNANFYHVVSALKEYVNVYDRKVSIINTMVTKSKAKRNITSTDLFLFFYDELKDIVEGTVYCPIKYSAQMLLKTVYEATQLQNFVAQQIRKGYVLIDVPTKNDGPETETEKQKRLRLQAERMRAAKAKKKAEREALKLAEQTKKKEETKKQEVKKAVIDDNAEYIEMLKKM